MSLACDTSVEFDPENPALPAPSAAKSWNGTKNGNGYNGNGNGHKNNGNGSRATDQNVREKKAQMTTGNNIPTEPQKVVRLAVTESEDPSRDAHLLREVIGVLLEYPGRDRVNLDIRTGERLVRMDLPVVSTGYSERLHSRLEELLGPDTVAVHQELGLGMDPPAETLVSMPFEALEPVVPEPTPEPIPEAIFETVGVVEPASVTVAEAAVTVVAEVSETVGGDDPPF